VRTASVRAGEIASESWQIVTSPDRESAPGFLFFDVNAAEAAALAQDQQQRNDED